MAIMERSIKCIVLDIKSVLCMNVFIILFFMLFFIDAAAAHILGVKMI